MYKISSFKSIEIKHDIYRSKDCIKKFDESVREHAMKIINFKKKKKKKLLTKEKQESRKKKRKNLLYLSKQNWKRICEKEKNS